MTQTAPAQSEKRSRQRRSHAALQAFFNIAERWELKSAEQRTLLGDPPKSTFYKWRQSPEKAELSQDTLERISYILGIYKSLHILLPRADVADTWIRRPNTAPGFAGASALKRMLGGHVVDLADVRRYLDAQRG